MKTYKRIEDTGLYVDCNKLAERLYQVRFKMPKRDRAVLERKQKMFWTCKEEIWKALI